MTPIAVRPWVVQLFKASARHIARFYDHAGHFEAAVTRQAEIVGCAGIHVSHRNDRERYRAWCWGDVRHIDGFRGGIEFRIQTVPDLFPIRTLFNDRSSRQSPVVQNLEDQPCDQGTHARARGVDDEIADPGMAAGIPDLCDFDRSRESDE